VKSVKKIILLPLPKVIKLFSIYQKKIKESIGYQRIVNKIRETSILLLTLELRFLLLPAILPFFSIILNLHDTVIEEEEEKSNRK
jgi:hypothetical protein